MIRRATAGVLHRLLLGSLLIWLGACSALPRPAGQTGVPGRDALDAFMIEGRFSLRHENRNHSGRLSWRHDRNGDEILLASPLGQGLAEIISNREGARLSTSDGQAFIAGNAEQLTMQVLGYALPIGRLTDWVRGRGQPDAQTLTDRFGRPQRLAEDDWTIEYEYDSEAPQAPPARLFIERKDAFDLRLRIDEWNQWNQWNQP